MLHWVASSVLGLCLTGRWRPVCAAVYEAPDCRARRTFLAAMDKAFAETGHCRRIALTYRIGKALRRDAQHGMYDKYDQYGHNA